MTSRSGGDSNIFIKFYTVTPKLEIVSPNSSNCGKYSMMIVVTTYTSKDSIIPLE